MSVRYAHQNCVVALSKLAQQLWVPCDVLDCFNIKYPCPIIGGGNVNAISDIMAMASSSSSSFSETGSFFLPLLCAMKELRIASRLLSACSDDKTLSLSWFWCSIVFI